MQENVQQLIGSNRRASELAQILVVAEFGARHAKFLEYPSVRMIVPAFNTNRLIDVPSTDSDDAWSMPSVACQITGCEHNDVEAN